MKSHDIVNILGTIGLVIGVFFAFLPHALHSGLGALIGLGDTPHETHVVIGFVLMIISLAVLGYNNNSFTFWQRKK
ncbi:MAG: hypothetical protein HYW22_00445 [Candidatus Aenigmarchaeota archaeon]|nr:hypothetical protein [Candidatus Aenigmarchaeota archaeon]